MALIEFKDLPDTSTPLNAENLNNNFNELAETLAEFREFSSGNGIIDHTYVVDKTENRIEYKRYGNLTQVNFWLNLNSNITGTYPGARKLASGLPLAMFYQEGTTVSTDGTYGSAYVSIDEEGNFYINPRNEEMTNKIILGGFLYISK